MDNIGQRIKDLCNEKNLSISNLLMKANIQSGDFYQVVNGKKPFFPAWRKRIANVLNISESELFPEYQGSSEGVQ